MISRRLISIFLSTFAALAPMCADVLYEWNFDDLPSTNLTQTDSNGKIKADWNLDFDDTMTNGFGQLIVRRTPDGAANTYVPISAKAYREIADEVWIQADIDGWHFKGKSASETMRLGIVHITDEERPHVLAQIILERTDSHQVSIAAEAFGEASKSMAALPIFDSEQNDAVSFVLYVNKKSNTFKLHYRIDEGPYLYLGEGTTSPDREIRYLRLGFSGYFNASDEALRINRIAYLSHNPIESAQ
ncbi:hypothetical protein QEH52_13290 [Coraliomargarita sp. SDUM461003]|uniref:Alginate lyase 2 domain-containing protein n=1 Tax=Thalassobacterium maritimum TaxID=3041265 RepID=A0ABU1AZV1_9BACT|nr:hypothetical protein [Coraliomargarita sp. SDUM461003]MDQ8208492.1 hypothetical protein [Coraliomargarita sp. SDUM461003]